MQNNLKQKMCHIRQLKWKNNLGKHAIKKLFTEFCTRIIYMEEKLKTNHVSTRKNLIKIVVCP